MNRAILAALLVLFGCHYYIDADADGECVAGEECDGGPGSSDDGSGACVGDCAAEAAECGNGVLEPGEECDLGDANSDEAGAECFNNCRGKWVFVSIPDFLNADIGDVSALTGQVNSINDAHRAAIAYVLDAVAAEQPDFVLVAGDMVNGHWDQDAAGVQVFGPVNSRAAKAAAIRTAASVYYPQWSERFAERGLAVHTAVGDHEIGDNNWPAGSDAASLVSEFKAAFAEHFTLTAEGQPRYQLRPTGSSHEHTAYAFRHKNVMVVTVDVFRQDDPAVSIDPKTGSVRADVAGAQLQWLDGLLADAAADPEIDHIVVQGHTPALAPVRFQNSSNLTMPDGASSGFWKALERHGVDLYLCGEVHHMTARHDGGVEQVSHGGIMGYARNTSYMVATVYPDRVELELKWIRLTYPSANTARLWQAGSNRPREQYAVDTTIGFTTAGQMVIDKSGAETVWRDRSGFFVLYGDASPADPGLLVHLPLDDVDAGQTRNLGVSGAVNDGFVSGAQPIAGGVLGGALALDGDDRVVAGVTPLGGRNPRTTAIWLRVDPAAAGLDTAMTMGANAAGGKWDVDVDLDNGGVIELGVGRGRTDGSGGPSVAGGAWHHVAAVLPANGDSLAEAIIYVDGEPVGLAANADRAIATASGELILGHSANTAGFQSFRGALDDVAIWGRALGAIEVRAIVSLARVAGLDAGDVERLLAAFAARADVTAGGRLWEYRASGLTGVEGAAVLCGSGIEINLGAGAGFRAN